MAVTNGLSDGYQDPRQLQLDAPPQLTLAAAQNYAAFDQQQAAQWANVGNTSGTPVVQTVDRVAYNQAQAERSKRMQAQDLFNRKQAQANAYAQDILFGPRAEGATGPDRRLSPLNIIPTAQRVAQAVDQYERGQALDAARQNPPQDAQEAALAARGDSVGLDLYRRANATGDQYDFYRYQEWIRQHQDPSTLGEQVLVQANRVREMDVPGMKRVADVAGQVGRFAGKHAVTGALLAPGAEYIPGINKATDLLGTAAGFVAESAIPTTVGAVLLELFPGIGTVPGAASAVREGMPALRIAARQAGMRLEEYVASRQGREALIALLEKRGIKGVAGAAETPEELAAKAAAGAGDAARTSLPADNLPLPPETVSKGINSIATKMRDMIAAARKLGPEQARMISEQKGQRVENAAQKLAEGSGFDAFHSSKSALAGEYGKPTFEAPNMPVEDINAMVDHIRMFGANEGEHPTMFYFRQLDALTAIEKWTMGIKPQNAELKNLESFLPNIRLRKAFEEQAMQGPIRGVGGIADAMRALPSRGGTQPFLGADAAKELATQREMAQNILQRLADGKALTESQQRMVAAEAERMRELGTTRGATQARLGSSTADELARSQEAAQNILQRVAEAERLRGEQMRMLGAEAERTRQLPSDTSVIPERGLPPSPTGVADASLGQLPEAGMQMRLADAVNEALVGAVTAGRATPEKMHMLRKFLHEAATVTTDIMTLPKALKAGIDIGWGGRNGVRLAPRNPSEWWRMWKKQFTALRSEKWANEMDAETRAFVNFERSQSMPEKLAYLQPGTGNAETSGEEFTSRITKHIRATVAHHEVGLAGFERAYVHPGNWFRQALLDKWVTKQVKRTHLPVSDKDFQGMISLLNKATLRGDTRFLERIHGQGLASVLFSLKGVVSGPQFAFEGLRAIAGGGGHSAATRRIMAENFGAYVGMGMGALGLAATTGWALDKNGKPSWVNVDLNHLSPTFGMIDVGGVRWNYWGADQPLVRLAIQLAERKVQRPGSPAVDISGRDAAVKWFGNKLAPGLPSAGWDEAVNHGKTYRSGVFNEAGMSMNSPMGALIYAFNQVSPIPLESAVNAWKDIGPAAVPFALAADVQGFTTSTYDTTPTEKQAAAAAKQPVLKALEAYIAVPNEEFKNRAVELSGAFGGTDMGKYGSLAEFKAAYKKDWAPVIAKERGVSLHTAEDLAAKEVDANPAVKKLTQDVNDWQDDYWRNHPDQAQQAWDAKVDYAPRSDIRKELGIK